MGTNVLACPVCLLSSQGAWSFLGKICEPWVSAAPALGSSFTLLLGGGNTHSSGVHLLSCTLNLSAFILISVPAQHFDFPVNDSFRNTPFMVSDCLALTYGPKR